MSWYRLPPGIEQPKSFTSPILSGSSMTESLSDLKFKSILKSLISSRHSHVFPALMTRASATSIVSSPAASASHKESIHQTLAASPPHRGEKAVEAAIPVLSLIAAASEGIPIAGGPLKVVIASLLEILKAFEQSRRNRERIEDLRLRLDRLNDMILKMDEKGFVPSRDTLNKQLSETEWKLREVLKMPTVRFQRVADLIKGICEDINNYLQEYLVVTVVEIREARVSSSMYLVDTMGNKHEILMDFARTFEQFKRTIGTIYIPDSPRDIVHRRYLEANRFHLGIITGTQIIDIKNDYDMHELVRPGITVIMSVVVPQQIRKGHHKCPICGEKYGQQDITTIGEW
ncbi:hypothetical protein C0995_006826 [Termitomyces sp. Mi166|nr:hypothetical protein C0995_006826 [Termitomyces sp. Mi166\